VPAGSTKSSTTTQLIIERRRVRVYTRNGFDWTERYSGIANAAGEFDCRSAIIDGEIIVQRKYAQMPPHYGKFVSYYRVSTDRQGRSGLGLDAQKAAVQQRPNGGQWQLIAEFIEIESGKRAKRPQLDAALAACKKHNAKLVVAKLDRLSRNVSFLLKLIESRVEVLFADLPELNGAMGKFVLITMASVAELEAGLISERTKAALKAAKARGVKLAVMVPKFSHRDIVRRLVKERSSSNRSFVILRPRPIH
jgi:DNA invertase Pin-like site-specific DNA recombinase